MWFDHHTVMLSDVADGMANSVDPHQTAPSAEEQIRQVFDDN